MSVFLPGIYLAALLHGAFLISLLIRNGRWRASSLLLSSYVLILMISLWNISMPYMDVPNYLKFKIIDLKLYATPFFWGPLIYLYVRSMTGPKSVESRQLWVHLSAPTIITLSQVFLSERSSIPSLPTFLLNCFYIQAGIYLIFAYKHVIAHQKAIQNTFSQTDNIHLNWLKNLLTVFGAALAIDLFLNIAVRYNLIEFGPAVGLIVLLECAIIFAVGYFSLQQPEILFPENINSKTTKKKYDNSALDDDLSTQLANQLTDLMATVQPYKRNDLKLGDLAELMNLSNHHLSQLINEKLGCNFYEFINRYRIEYAEGLMKHGEHINITKLAFDAGFNNRVSFTNAFKKQTGQTPSAYLKAQAFKQAS
ncbi:MAG: helix-turn-helix domain-containing protein [Kordiimonas sp.]